MSRLEDRGVSTTSTSRQEHRDEREAHQSTAPAHDPKHTSCSRFYADRSKLWIIQSVPLLTIECLRSAGSQQLLSTLNHQEFAMTRSDADAAIILTSSPKPFPVGQRRDFSLIKNGFARCGSKIVERAHRARVVCVLFLSCLTR